MTTCEKDEKKHKIGNENDDEMLKRWEETQNTEWKRWRDVEKVKKNTKHRKETMTRCGNGEKEHKIEDGNHDEM